MAESLVIERELNTVPYSFEHPIPNQKVAQLIQIIQNADRKAGFTIGGVTKYVIDYTMGERRKNRKARKIQRIGMSAQRFNDLREINVKEL